MSEAAPAPQGKNAPATGLQADHTRRGLSSLTMAGIGCALTALAIGAVVATASMQSGSRAGSELSLVEPGEISNAATTLASQFATTLVDDAKSCRTPMATVSVSRQPGGRTGVIRIRSGSYLSPAFTLTDMPQRIAIPFPTAYASGKGTISVEGTATNAVVSLFPAVNIENLVWANVISIWWTPRKPC
jgi:hypothetical protein